MRKVKENVDNELVGNEDFRRKVVVRYVWRFYVQHTTKIDG